MGGTRNCTTPLSYSSRSAISGVPELPELVIPAPELALRQALPKWPPAVPKTDPLIDGISE